MNMLRVSYYVVLISATLLVVSAIATAPTVEVVSRGGVLVAVSD